MANNIFGIILAGGQGTRMGNAERPKQFMEIGKKPIIIHTIEKFAIHSAFDKVIVLSPRIYPEIIQRCCCTGRFHKKRNHHEWNPLY